MRRLLIGLGIVVLLVIAGALTFPYFVDVNQYRDRIQTELHKKLNRPVSLGKMRLSLLPLSFQVENAVIGDDPAFPSARAFATADRLSISAKLLPLLRKEIQVDSIELESPRIELIRNPQGIWNVSTIGQGAKPPASAPSRGAGASPTPEQTKDEEANSFSLDFLQIKDGQIAVTDLLKREPRTVYDHIDLEAQHFEPGQPVHVNASAHLPGEGNQLLSVSATAGFLQKEGAAKVPLDGTLKLNQVTLAGINKYLNSSSLNDVDGIASGEAKIRNDPNGEMSSEGELKLEQGRIHGVDLGYPVTVNYNFALDNKTQVLTIKRGDLSLGSTPLTIVGEVNAGATPSALKLQILAREVSVTEIARLAAAFGSAFNPGTQVSGKLNADLKIFGTTAQPDLRGSISANDVTVSRKDLLAPVKISSVQIALDQNQVRTNQFTATLGSTSLVSNLALSNYSRPDRAIDASVQTTNAQLSELLQIGRAYGLLSLEGITGSGSVSLAARAQGPIKDTAAVSFSGNGSLTNAEINMPQLTKPLLVKNANLRFSQNAAILENLALSLGSTNATGKLTASDFKNPRLQFSLAADKVIVSEWEQMTQAAPTHAFLSLIPQANAEPSPSSGPLGNVVGSGTLAIASVLYDQIVLSNARSNITMDRGIIRLAPLTAELFGGNETGSIVIDTKGNRPTYTVNTKLQHVDSNKLLSSISSLKQTLFGLLAANASANFVSGASTTDIAKSLNGDVSMNLQDGKLANVDLLYQLANIGKFLQTGRQPQSFTNLLRLTGNMQIRNGVAQTNNLLAAIEGGTVAGSGTMNLVSQALDMRLTAVLAKTYSEKVGGSKVGGFLNTALANNKGELVIPVLVTGTFEKPRVAPDLQKLAQMRLQNLLPTSANPGSLTNGLLGTILSNGKGGKTSGGLQGVLGTLGARRPQPGQSPNATPSPQAGQSSQSQSDALGGQLTGLIDQLAKRKKKDQQQPPPK